MSFGYGYMDGKAMGEQVSHSPLLVNGEEQAILQFEYEYLAWFWCLH